MVKNIYPAFLLLLALTFCHSRSALDEAGDMAKAYAECTARYGRLQEELNAKLKNTPPGRELDKIMAACSRTLADKNAALEKLLSDWKSSAGSDQLDLLRSKIMIETGRFADAEKIIDRLSSGRSRLALEAKLQKVIVRLLSNRSTEALSLFKEIEPQIKKDSQFFQICLALARSSTETRAKEEYSFKFLAGPELPAALRPFKTEVYAILATLARESHQPEKAKGYLEKALAADPDQAQQADLHVALKQVALLGQPAPVLKAETWFNSPPLTISGLKGQVAVIYFWAPWCAPCRAVMPELQDEFRQFKNKGLQVIGYARLFGRTGIGVGGNKKISAAEELALIKSYLDKNLITYPVAVGAEGLGFEAYAVAAIPTMVFIDRSGRITQIKSGSGNSRQTSEWIKSLLAEK